jgi:hypothetical membrane protein
MKINTYFSLYWGFLVILFYCIFTFISVGLFPPPFSPIDNWLSDLGNSSYNPNGAIFYNLGCITTGIALFPFFIGLYVWKTEKLWNNILLIATIVIGCFSGFALILIGFYSEDFMAPHVFWSNIFFETILLVLVLAGISLFLHKDFIRWIAIYGFIVFLFDLFFVFFVGKPILEWIVVFTALGYVGLIVYNSYKLRP